MNSLQALRCNVCLDPLKIENKVEKVDVVNQDHLVKKKEMNFISSSTLNHLSWIKWSTT